MMHARSLQDKKKSQIMKIVFHVPVDEEKSRAKAMTIASKIKGVTNVAISKEINHMVVIGEGVDSVDLANCLRKKLQFADIVSVKSMNAAAALVMNESGLSKDDYFDMQTRFNQPTYEYQNEYSDATIAIRPRYC